MKHILLLFLAGILLAQGGCALGPTIDEQSRQERNEQQSIKQSDAFARNLPE